MSVADTKTISFARGAPSLDIVDIEGLKSAAVKAFDTDPGGVTGYGTSVGYLPLREWIAKKHGVHVDQVMVTNGSMQADAFLFDQLVEEDTPVIVERPTYDRTLLGLRARRGQLHPITLEDDGLDVAELRALLESGVRPALAHIIPNFQNPAGVTLSMPKRQELLALAEEYGFVIFEDDPYHDVRFRGETLPRMLDMDGGKGNVVYASSFSKTVCPGVRVGYLVGPSNLIAQICKAATNTYIAPNMVAQAIVHQFAMSGALDQSVKTVRFALNERADTLATALRKHLPDATFTVPDGGYFLWVELGADIDVDELLHAAAARHVAIVKGTDFLLEGGEGSLRLAYSAVRTEDIDEGVRRLAEAVNAMR